MSSILPARSILHTCATPGGLLLRQQRKRGDRSPGTGCRNLNVPACHACVCVRISDDDLRTHVRKYQKCISREHARGIYKVRRPCSALLARTRPLRLGASSLRRRRTMLHETFESSSRGLQRVLEPDCVYMRTTEIVAHQILARAQISVVAIFVSSSTLPWKLASWSRDCTHDRTP
jgi:hypothetical protein